MITTESRIEKDCPCGCERKVPYLTGTIALGDSSPFFQAYMLNDGDGPHLWLMLHSGPWEHFTKDCALVIHSYPDESELRCFLIDQEYTPWKKIDAEELHFLTKQEIMSQSGGRDWAFHIHDYFVDNQEEINDFLQSKT